MRHMSFVSLFASAVVVTVTPAAAHHSAAAAYDESRHVEAQGTVTKVLVRNPHSWIFLESGDGKGEKIEWQIEMGGASSMAWAKDALAVGTSVKVVGHPSRAPGTHGMTGATFATAEGKPLGPRATQAEPAPR